MIDQGIVRPARRLRLAIIGAAVLLMLAYLVTRLGFASDSVRVETPHEGGVVGIVLTDLRLLLLMAALWQLVRMLRALECGELFSARVTSGFRGFAFWLTLFALGGVASPLLLGLLEHRAGTSPVIQLDLGDLLAFGLTLVLFLIARLLERARRIEDEMREIV